MDFSSPMQRQYSRSGNILAAGGDMTSNLPIGNNGSQGSEKINPARNAPHWSNAGAATTDGCECGLHRMATSGHQPEALSLPGGSGGITDHLKIFVSS